MQIHRALISALILSVFLAACSPSTYAPVTQTSDATSVLPAASEKSNPANEAVAVAVTPTLAPTPAPSATPAMENVKWDFDSTCGEVPAVSSLYTNDSFWTLVTTDGKGIVEWNLSSDKGAPILQWRYFKQFTRLDSSNTLAFIGTDKDQKRWLIVIQSRCSKGAELSQLIPLEDQEPVYFQSFWSEKTKAYEAWLLTDKKLILYHAKDFIGQVYLSLDKIPPYTAFTITGTEDLNQDGKPDRYLRWWNWTGHWESDRKDVKKIQILAEDSTELKVIGEIESSWGMIDLKNDGRIEYLKPVPPDAHEKWEIYAFQGDKYGWDGEVKIPASQPAVALQPDQLPPLPNDLYFTRDGKGWVWPKEGGSLKSVPVKQPELKLSPCTGKPIKPEDHVIWSPSCRFRIDVKPGEVEGGSSIIVDQLTGKQFDVPNSFVYARGLTTFAWDPDNKYVVYASADGNPGLFKIDVPSFEIKPITPFQLVDALLSYGSAFPTVLQDSSIVFLVEGAKTDLFPPPGIYRAMPDGQLRKLAGLPAATLFDHGNMLIYGDFFPSPKGEVFLFAEHNDYYALPNYLSMKMVDAEGKNVWDATPVLDQGEDFRWLP